MSLLEWQQELGRELAVLRGSSLLRTLGTHVPGLDFSSNDYLSLNSSGRLRAMLRETVEQWGEPWVGSTASRLVRGHYEVFARLEDEFAGRVSQGSALFFGSGYMANVGSLSALVSPRDWVFCDRLAHASLLDGIRLSGCRRYYFRHNDPNDLESRLRRYSRSRGRGQRLWLVTESLFSMDGDLCDLGGFCSLAERYEICIYLDEAHALGVYGEGRGLAAESGLSEQIAVLSFPCGKAPGLMGALVCGPKVLRDLLIQKARTFIYSTAPPPFLAELLRRTLGLILSPELGPARRHIQVLGRYLRSSLGELGFSTGPSVSQIVPLIIGPAEGALGLAQACQGAGYDVRAIRPPTVPPGQSRLRLSLQAAHTKGDIDGLLSHIGRGA